jgi:hypothetical protein
VIATRILSLHSKKSFWPCGKLSTVHSARTGQTTSPEACGYQQLA